FPFFACFAIPNYIPQNSQSLRCEMFQIKLLRSRDLTPRIMPPGTSKIQQHNIHLAQLTSITKSS
uniref:Uncharacterized protein n=1 Tax=Oryza brachyantha TaxID=4533 RepID=J3M4Y0_ORYBR